MPAVVIKRHYCVAVFDSDSSCAILGHEHLHLLIFRFRIHVDRCAIGVGVFSFLNLACEQLGVGFVFG